LGILKPGFRILVWSTLMPYSFSFIYIFLTISYKKNVHRQMSIRIGNGTVVNDYPIDFIHITLIYCTEWLFFTKCSSIRMLKTIRFSAITAVTWPSNFLWILVLYDYFAWLNKTEPATFHNFAV
jgi:hypothetical protein